MLTITQSTNASHYFAHDVSRADYYLAGDALPPMWLGKGAEMLGLEGRVHKEQFAALCNNRHPLTHEQLTLRQIKATPDGTKRTQGYDFTFDVPKSVSVVWARTQDPAILEAVRMSARETMLEQIEPQMMTRVRKHGADHNRVTGNLIVAEFMHMETRPTGDDLTPDPQIHIHNFVPNATFCAEEKAWKAGQFRELKRNAPYFGADFESRLAGRLATLGYEIERNDKSWEIAGLGRELRDSFSRRTIEIEAEAAKRGITDPKAKAELGAITRKPKGRARSAEELQGLWSARMSDAERERIDSIQHRAEATRYGPKADRDSKDRGQSQEQRFAESLNAIREHRRVNEGPKLSPEQVEALKASERRAASDAVAFAMEHLTERLASPRKLDVLAEAMRRTAGRVPPRAIQDAFDRAPIITREVNGQILCTTEAILKEEQKILQFARVGRGRCQAFDVYERFSDRGLNAGQRAVIKHLLTSPDQLMIVRGPAGTGKTRLMKAAVKAIVDVSGRHLQTLAPSSEASRGVLRKEGFANADTVAKFLVDSDMQKRAAKGTLWVDEAGLMGTKTMARLLDTAGRLGCRVILSGDHLQHKSVERGQPFRCLIEQAGLKIAGLSEIVRQRGMYKTAIEHLARGDTSKGIDRLDKLGAIREVSREEMRRSVVSDYQAARHAKESVIFVAPTHAAVKEITDAIRTHRKETGELKGARTFRQLASKQLTVAERKEVKQYEVGDVIQFTRAVKSYIPRVAGFKAGEQVTVIGRNLAGGVMVRRSGILDRPLPLKHAERFDVYRPSETEIAKGDRVRFTRNGYAKANWRSIANIAPPGRRAFPPKVRNGATHTVWRITPRGDLILTSGEIIDKNHGFIEHGYADTSHGSQGKTVARTVVCVPNDALRAVSPEQGYVAASRGQKSCVFYVEDKQKFKDALQRTRLEPNASEWSELPERPFVEDVLRRHRHHSIQEPMDLDRAVKKQRGGMER